jgi:hypothetical protein
VRKRWMQARVSAGGSRRERKTRQGRRATPAFQMVAELSPTQWRIHLDAAASVDAVLDGRFRDAAPYRNGQPLHPL